jgi:Caspase domain
VIEVATEMKLLLKLNEHRGLKMNIGIVIGVSDYQKVSSLPGCRADAQSIKQLLDLSNKCDDILFISENTYSKDVKSQLTAFVKKHESNKINEVIFYFSGHGLFDENEFYYVLSDYTETKTKQTSLENSELDNLLKSLSANLTVKIVDACQAGTRYIKDPDVFRKYLKQSEQQFDKCYFFYSSQNNQSSYQSENISDFTSSFLNAFITRPNQDIRYKDLMDSISDDFSSNLKQTPFFVFQGNYTETFGYITEDIAAALKRIITIPNDSEEKQADISLKSLVELIQDEAKLYCTQEEAIIATKKLEQAIKNFKFSSEIDSIFNIKIQPETATIAPVSTEYVGKHLNNTSEYMADIKTEKKYRKVPKNKLLANLNIGLFLNEAEMIDEVYMSPVGASSTVELPYNFITIRLQSKFPNVNDSGCVIMPFVSQTKIIVFSSFYFFKIKEWDTKTVDQSSLEWSNFEEYIKDYNDFENSIEILLKEFEEFSVEPIKKRFEISIEDIID